MAFSLAEIRQKFDLYLSKVRARGYKTISMLNSTEHEISTAHKN